MRVIAGRPLLLRLSSSRRTIGLLCAHLRKSPVTTKLLFPSRLWAGILTIAVSGCGASSSDFASAAPSSLLAPFVGQWTCDVTRTQKANKVDGQPIAINDAISDSHPDITISGNTATYQSILASEYMFFGLHDHNGAVCGKAWHHEDRNDPGDMSKCYVRLKLVDGQLRFDVRMKEQIDLDDPDLHNMPAADSGSADDCDVDHPAGKDWTGWTAYVFTRK
jgi:hypothetical protein